MHIKTKCLIVGGGVAAMSAAIYAARGGLEPIVARGGFKGGSTIPGGQLMITTDVENFPGFPDGISGPELVEKMSEQALKFGSKFIDEFAVEFKFDLTSSPPLHEIILEDGTIVEAYSIIIATGALAKWLNADDEEKFVNKGISACATCDGPLPMFRDQPLAVIGGGDSAVEEATFLSKFASKVYLIVRRNVLRAGTAMQKRLETFVKEGKVHILYETAVTGYLGDDNGNLSDIIIHSTAKRNVEMATRYKIGVKGVFMAIGHEPATKMLRNTPLDLDENGYINTYGPGGETNIKGVYAAGDVHDTHFRQAITAAGFGCSAEISAERYICSL